MDTEIQAIKQRKDLHTISVKPEIWDKAREIAEVEEKSISMLFRDFIKKLYKKRKVEAI